MYCRVHQYTSVPVVDRLGLPRAACPTWTVLLDPEGNELCVMAKD